MNALEELPVKTIAPGHGEAAGKEYFVELRGSIKQMIDQGKTLDEIKQAIDFPFFLEWTGVDVKERTENIEHVYGELSR